MRFEPVQEQPCVRVFRVELDAHEYRHAREHALRRVAARVTLPGFRPGKVPEAVLVQRFGRQVDEETLEHALGHALEELLERTGLEPIANPRALGIQRTADGLAFHVTIELAPEVVLGAYRGLALERAPALVRPEDVDAVIDSIRHRFVSYAPAGRPARWGDLAVIDYDGTADGVPLDGARGRDVGLLIGAGDSMRPLEEALVGRSPGDAFEVSVPYPETHTNEALRGKTLNLSVTVKEIKAGTLPPLDDALARSVGNYETLEALRASIREKLRAEREAEAVRRLRAEVADRLTAFVPESVAPSLVEEEMQYMAVRGAESLARAGIRRIEQLRLTPQAYRELFRPSAVRAVREAFVLEAIARKEGLVVSDEDLEAEIRKSDGGGEAASERAVQALKADGRWERLRARLRQDRALDLVIREAAVSIREIRL